MLPLIDPKTMRASEAQYFSASDVKSVDIMENAARALADVIRRTMPLGGKVYLACGTGGNGGDGLACARLLEGDYDCTVILPKAVKSDDALINLHRLGKIPVLENASDLPRPDVWVDALFGTGLTRAPSGDTADLIRRIRADHAEGSAVFAADIPSGLNGATGKAYEPCVQAGETVTFQFMKTGMTLADGLDMCGKIAVADVGFPQNAFPALPVRLMQKSDLASCLPPRKRNIHKGSCGHLLIIAGSFGMAGAAAMCAKGALRSGAGLVSVACPSSIVPILQTLVPQAMCIPLKEENGAISSDAIPELQQAVRGKTALAVGCGLSRRASAEILKIVLDSKLPAVIDADGLNLLSENPEFMKHLRPHHILTPHPGEAARLMPNLDLADPVASARHLAELNAVILLKGAASVIASPNREDCFISASGGCGMARGGSGDILTGILGALLAEGTRTSEINAVLASEIHGLAGELAQEKYGSRAMNAADILEFLPEVFPR